jgi:transcriptional regulator with XRE-family HTH domain
MGKSPWGEVAENMEFTEPASQLTLLKNKTTPAEDQQKALKEVSVEKDNIAGISEQMRKRQEVKTAGTSKEKAQIVGGRLWGLLQEKKINQSQLARRLGINRGTVSSYINGINVPPYGKICQIADCLEIAAEYLLGQDNISEISEQMRKKREWEKIKRDKDKAQIVGGRLWGLLQAKKMTQVQLARELGTYANTISKYINGEHVPSYGIICKIADYFGVSVEYFLEQGILSELSEQLRKKR